MISQKVSKLVHKVVIQAFTNISWAFFAVLSKYVETENLHLRDNNLSFMAHNVPPFLELVMSAHVSEPLYHNSSILV